MVALRDGLARLEATLREESERERIEQMMAEDLGKSASDTAAEHEKPEIQVTPEAADAGCRLSSKPAASQPKRCMSKLEREACRRLLRQATAAQQAQVKGNCLMIMQMLTRREVVRSHTPW